MTLRANGSYIGPRASAVTVEAASGVWDLRTAQRQRAAAAWPTVRLDPATIAGLQLWLDASDSSTLYDATTGGSLVAADGTVKRWEDKSGNNRHATESTNGPQRKTAVQGGLDVLRFDGSDDVLRSTYSVNGQAAITVFAVAKSYSEFSTLLSNYSILTPSSTFANGFFLRLGSSVNAYGVSMEGRPTAQGGSYFPASRSLSGTDSFAAVTGKYDGTAMTPYLNGTQGTADTGPTGNLVQTASEFAFGSNASVNPTVFHQYDLAEVLIYNSALSDTDREAVENYLMAKWGIV